MTNESKLTSCPLVAFEFAATQLILRANGFRTSELNYLLKDNGDRTVTVLLQIKRKTLGSRLIIGTLPISIDNANRLWITWQETASHKLLTDFNRYQPRLKAFKLMEETLQYLEKAGFELKDSAIVETADPFVN